VGFGLTYRFKYGAERTPRDYFRPNRDSYLLVSSCLSFLRSFQFILRKF
jgi:hypothetical protein